MIIYFILETQCDSSCVAGISAIIVVLMNVIVGLIYHKKILRKVKQFKCCHHNDDTFSSTPNSLESEENSFFGKELAEHLRGSHERMNDQYLP
jgi:hypothetical protein